MRFNIFHVNKKLLPMKGHYFLHLAGQAPISPFIPVIAKDLGFTAISVGWLFTVTPIVSFFLKPIIGSIADKFKVEKAALLILLALGGLTLYGIQWVPPITNNNPARLNCNSVLVDACTGFMNGDNQTFIDIEVCKVQCFPGLEGGLENLCEVLHTNLSTGTLWSSCSGDGMEEALTEYGILSQYQFWLLLVLVVTSRVTAGVINTLADCIALSLLDDQPEKYGLTRVWGSIGWGIVAFLASFLVDTLSEGKPTKDYTVSFSLLAAFFILDIFLVSSLKIKPKRESKNILNDVTTVLKDPKIILFLFWCFFNGYYHSSIFNFLLWFVEDLDSAGTSGVHSKWIKTLGGLISLIQTFGGEIPMFFFSNRVLKKMGHERAMTAVLLSWSARLLLYSAISNPWLVLPVEVLHGFTYGLFYSAMTTYAKSVAAPGTEVTLQSLVSVTFEGAGYCAGGVLTGYLIKALGYSKTFMIMSTSAMTFTLAHLCIINFSSLIKMFSQKNQVINLKEVL